MGKKSDELNAQEINLNHILDSLYFKQLKDIKNPFIADNKKLIFKIVDNCQVTESIAKKYLNILESRNFIEIGDNSVYYNQKKFNERRNKEIDETNKFFKSIKK